MKQLTITINGKGGVGKSLFTINFLSYLEERGIAFHAFDTDHENSTLRRFYPTASFLDVERQQEVDAIFEALDKDNLVIVDARAASTDLFLNYFKELRIFDYLREINARLTIVSPINHEADSIEQVRVLVEALEQKASYVIVKNRSHSNDFEIWDESNISKRVQEMGGMEIIMPRIYDWICSSLQEHDQTVAKALKSDVFKPLDQQRLRNWQVEFHAELDKARELLLPSQVRSAAEALAARRTSHDAPPPLAEVSRRQPRVADVKNL